MEGMKGMGADPGLTIPVVIGVLRALEGPLGTDNHD